jgi:serine phosphatase RsbU (regulator of sigma subunit)
LNRIALIVLCVVSYAGQAQQSRISPATLAKMKAAFIYKFTQYVQWPNEEQMKQFNICVMSSQEMADQLRELEAVAKFRNRIPMRVNYCSSPDEAAKANMVVVDGAGSANLWSLYSKLRGKGVLMVAENLEDYRKSMISFVIVDSKMKYILNATKLDESNLVVKEDLYKNAIRTETDWTSVFDKFKFLAEHGDKEVRVDKHDLAQWVSEYKTLQDEKTSKELTIAQMEDSLNAKMRALEEKSKELETVGYNIEHQKKRLGELNERMKKQRGQLLLSETEIGKQRIVIVIIAGLTFGVLILLLVALRVNNKRRKANRLLEQQKAQIELQKQLVETKQKEILDSIFYAKRIQTALMANEAVMKDHLPEHFIFFRPKDIVAGDFYWAEPITDGFMYVTADSTGHGVPGAFMSLLNITKLNEAINQKRITRPDLILNDVKRGIIEALNPPGSIEVSRDGMDVVVCKLDLRNRLLQYAAANNSVCIVRNGHILEGKGDKMPIGKSHDDNLSFTLNEMQLESGDMIYTYTDGIYDQFGGPKGKKMKGKALKEMLVRIAVLPLSQQKDEINRWFEEWKGTLEQVDDVLLMGVRI